MQGERSRRRPQPSAQRGDSRALALARVRTLCLLLAASCVRGWCNRTQGAVVQTQQASINGQRDREGQFSQKLIGLALNNVACSHK